MFQKKIDVYTSSLSKGLGSFGGYVTSKKNVMIDSKATKTIVGTLDV